MNNLVYVILDGLSIAGIHWRLVAGTLLVLLISQFLLVFVLRKIFGDKIAPEEYFSLSLAGWLLPALLISLLWYAGAQIISPQFSMILIGLILLVGLYVFIRNYRVILGTFNGLSLSLFLLAGLLILLRLAYVSKAVFPLYFDSAQHYHFIKGLLTDLESSGTGPVTGYYHLGFHFL